MFLCVQMSLDLASRECTGPRAAVFRVLDADLAPEAIIPTVLVTRTDAFNVCGLISNDDSCNR